MKKVILGLTLMFVCGSVFASEINILPPPPPPEEGRPNTGNSFGDMLSDDNYFPKFPYNPPSGGNNVDDPNPPPPEDDCECECDDPNNTGSTSANNGSVSLRINFGQFPFNPGIPGGSLQIYSPYADPILFTPAGLTYKHPIARRIVKNKNGSVNIYTQNGRVDYYSISGTGEGKTTGSSTYLNQYLFACDIDGKTVSANTSDYYKECFPNRTALIYDAQTKCVIKFISAEGIIYTIADLGLEIVRIDDVIQQVYNRTDGLLNIVSIAEQSYRIDWYKPADVGSKTDTFYSFSGAPIKQWTISNPEKDSRRLRRFHVLEQRGSDFRFDYLWAYYDQLNDWVFTRGTGSDAVVESKQRIDGNNEFTEIRILRTEGGKIAKKYTKTYGIFPFGVQLKNEKQIGNGVEKVTAHQYYSTVGEKGYGQVKKITYPDASFTEYTYDDNKRPLTQKRPTAFGDELLSYTYSAKPTEQRPLTVTKKINGSVVLTTTYVYTDDPINGNQTITTQTANGVSQSTRTEYYGTSAEKYAQGRIAKQVASNGVETFYDYMPNGNTGDYVETVTTGNVANQSTQTKNYFSADGNLTRSENWVNIEGSYTMISSVEHQYNPAHKIVKSIYSNGTTTEAAWICKGPTMQIDADGIKTEFFYDGAKRLIETKRYSPFGVQITQKRLDAADRVIEETFSCGNLSQTTQTTYDQLGRIVRSVDPAGLATSYTYANDFLTSTITNPRGATTITTRRSDGATASVTGTAVTPQYYAYDFNAGLQCTTVFIGSNNSERWQKTYANGLGQAIKTEQSAFGGAITSENNYNDKGQITQTLTTQSPKVSYEYGPLGDVIKTTTTDGVISRYTETLNKFESKSGTVWQTSTQKVYSSDATLAPIVLISKRQLSNLSPNCEMKAVSIDVRGNESTSWTQYDISSKKRTQFAQVPTASNIASTISIDGRTLTQTDITGVTTTSEYDALGRRIASTDGRGNTQRMEYNKAGQLVASIDGASNRTEYTYSQVGNLSGFTDAMGKTTHYAYNIKGQKIAEWGENAYPTRYEFDTFGNMMTLYTFRNPQAVITDEPSPALGDKTAWNYDVASNVLLSKTFANGKTTTYTYDLNGTLKTRTWARGITTSYTYDTFKQLLKTSYSDATPAITNTYNAMGEIKAITDIKGTTSFTYNNYGQVISESISGLYNKTLTQNYDNFGRKTGYSLDNEQKAVYTYNEQGRLIGMNIGGANFSFEYMNNANLLSKTIYPNGLERIISYEEKRNLITEVKNTLPNDVISQYSYTNDVLGRRINMGIYYNNTQKSNEYNYNPRSEVIGAQGNDLNQLFDYDNIGNRITSSNNNITTNYSTNNLNQYEGVGDFVPEFDADGNQVKIKTKTGVWNVEYNGENRPVKFTQENKVIEMKYDYMGRRVNCIYKIGSTLNKDRKFVYNGYTLVQELYNTNEIIKEFVWDPTAGEATRPLVMKHASGGGLTLFYTHDANKNVSELVFWATQNGISAHYEYDAFGNTIITSSNTHDTTVNIKSENPFRFSSEYHDDELGLIYYNYRHYNPQVGRWINRDPIAEKGGNNLYNFVKNNTLNFVDFNGLNRCTDYFICLGRCIEDNDILAKVDQFYIGRITLLITGGGVPKSFASKFFTLIGRNDLARTVALMNPNDPTTQLAWKPIKVILKMSLKTNAKIYSRLITTKSIPVMVAYGNLMSFVTVACGAYCCGNTLYHPGHGLTGLTEKIEDLIGNPNWDDLGFGGDDEYLP